MDAELVLNRDGGRREGMIRRRCADDDQIDFLRVDPRILERPARGDRGQVGGELALRGNMAFADAGALDDPLVGGVDHRRQIAIRQHLLRKITPNPTNHAALHAPAAFMAGAAGSSGRPTALSSAIMRTRPLRAISRARSMALAKPSASVPPCDLITIPFNPRNTPPFTLRGSIFSLSSWKAERPKT